MLLLTCEGYGLRADESTHRAGVELRVGCVGMLGGDVSSAERLSLVQERLTNDKVHIRFCRAHSVRLLQRRKKRE
jgi:hypothetical protein